MKKTTCIQLVLITAALAGCDRPLYLPGPPFPGSSGPYAPRPYYPPAAYGSTIPQTGISQTGTPQADTPEQDSTNSCPLAETQLPPDYYLWYSGLRPWDFFYGNVFNLNGYYAYRHPAAIVRAGFGRIASARVGGTGHS